MVVGMLLCVLQVVWASDFIAPRIFTDPSSVITMHSAPNPNQMHSSLGSNANEALQPSIESLDNLSSKLGSTDFNLNSLLNNNQGAQALPQTDSQGGVANAQLAVAYTLAPLMLVMDELTRGVKAQNKLEYQTLMKKHKNDKGEWEEPKIPLPASALEFKKKKWEEKLEMVRKGALDPAAAPVKEWAECPVWKSAPEWWNIPPEYMTVQPEWLPSIPLRSDRDSYRNFLTKTPPLEVNATDDGQQQQQQQQLTEAIQEPEQAQVAITEDDSTLILLESENSERSAKSRELLARAQSIVMNNRERLNSLVNVMSTIDTVVGILAG
eukprot:c19366_g1_i1.p1 GENE.c19366_g1_i1~~c19366_g1_i1.p1  ORF type:complete len:324 (-),score=85.86 c19366_g1_i1:66-1037(-)